MHKELKLGLLGYPLKKSLSPQIYNFLFKNYKIKGSYKLFKIKEKELNNFLNKKAILLDAFNITTPYKNTLINFSYKLIKEAKEIKSTNLIKVKNKKFYAYNSDIFGFIQAYKNLNFKNKTICIFGSGGASKAVIYALLILRAKKIIVISRNIKKAKKNLINFKSKVFFSTKPIKSDFFINTTIIPYLYYDKIFMRAFYIDLNYSLKEKKDFKDGKDMLFFQAIKNFSILINKKISLKESNILKNKFWRVYG